MPAQIIQRSPTPEATYKAREVEGILDLYFYRRVCFLALGAGISHAFQGAAADYYRTSYLYFVRRKSFVDLDSAAALCADYQGLCWRDQPWHKFLLALYLNFTRQQEMLSPDLKKMREVS